MKHGLPAFSSLAPLEIKFCTGDGHKNILSDLSYVKTRLYFGA
jgi:hypothetical protein